MIDALVEAGLDAARLNFSHGAHADHAEGARLVRDAQARAGRPLALIADLQGPKLRIGDLKAPLELAPGDRVRLTGDGDGSDGDLPVGPPVLPQVLRPGHDVLIDDGRVRLRVDEVEGGRVLSTVMVGGVVNAHKGLNVPGVPIPVPSLTEKDLRDLDFALGLDVDYVALSFVRSANDVRELRELLHTAGSEALVTRYRASAVTTRERRSRRSDPARLAPSRARFGPSRRYSSAVIAVKARSVARARRRSRRRPPAATSPDS